MRKRKIRKIGTSFYVKLEQTDMKDLDLEVGGEVLIYSLEENSVFVEKKIKPFLIKKSKKSKSL
jgi:hypothetical protein